jgi:hypothetical protein
VVGAGVPPFDNHTDLDTPSRFVSRLIGSACHPFREFYSLADASLLLMLPFAASRFSQVLWSEQENW